MARLSKLEQAVRMQHRLTPRDWQLLGWLYDHQLLTTDQIADALFPSVHAAQARLRMLTEYGLLLRFQPYRLQGGNFPYHYVLDHLGALIIAASRAKPPPRLGQSDMRIQRIVSSRNTDHRLGINGFFTQLAKYERLNDGATLHHWWPDDRLRWFTPPGTAMLIMVQADGLGVWSEDGRTVAFYLEYDTGTESLPTLVDKVVRFDQLEEGRWPVLFSLPSTVREANLHQRLASLKHRIPVATMARDRLDGANPAGQVWQLHRSAAPLVRLAELPMRSRIDLEVFAAEEKGQYSLPGRDER
ncbi:MAG TPA: replication-relaxation family protein [Candidatus Limnocylindrales bacterium]|nr:replication-relaxation family protein [Candidatus Limnocylindrales bacterium]